MCIPSIVDPCSILETGSKECFVYKYVQHCERYVMCSNVNLYNNVPTLQHHVKMYKYASVCVLGHNLTEQDTWWPRSLLTALISLEISKLGTQNGRYAAPTVPPCSMSKSPHFYWVLSLLSLNCVCQAPRQNLTSLIAAVKETQKIYNQDIKSICF